MTIPQHSSRANLSASIPSLIPSIFRSPPPPPLSLSYLSIRTRATRSRATHSNISQVDKRPADILFHSRHDVQQDLAQHDQDHVNDPCACGDGTEGRKKEKEKRAGVEMDVEMGDLDRTTIRGHGGKKTKSPFMVSALSQKITVAS